MYITSKYFGGQGQCFIRLCPDPRLVLNVSFSIYFFYQDAVQATCTAIEALAKKHGKAKMVDAIRLPPPELYKHVKVCFCFFFFGKNVILSRRFSVQIDCFLHTGTCW